MKKPLFLFSYKIFFASLILFAVTFQYFSDAQKPNFSSINFFSYFTVESNIIFAILLLISAIFLSKGKETKNLGIFRGGAVLYMVTTGIVYYILLYHLPDPNRIVWVNTIMHLIAPVVGLFDWFFDSPKQAISFRKALLWLVFPLFYVVYSLLRGFLTGWYPYQFLNPNGPGGIGTALTYSLIISIGAIFGTFVISKLGNFSRRLSKF